MGLKWKITHLVQGHLQHGWVHRCPCTKGSPIAIHTSRRDSKNDPHGLASKRRGRAPTRVPLVHFKNPRTPALATATTWDISMGLRSLRRTLYTGCPRSGASEFEEKGPLLGDVKKRNQLPGPLPLLSRNRNLGTWSTQESNGRQHLSGCESAPLTCT